MPMLHPRPCDCQLTRTFFSYEEYPAGHEIHLPPLDTTWRGPDIAPDSTCYCRTLGIVMAARPKSKPRSKPAPKHPGPAGPAEDDLRTGSSAPAELPPRSLEIGIGAEVRRLRKSLDLTVAELGAAARISAGMLSKIENGAISPSLATLDALAKALNVPISRLFAETDERRDCSFVKAGGGVRIERRGTKAGHLYDLLGHSLAGEIGVEPYLITLKQDAMPYTHFRHAGIEFLYMLSGKVRYRHGDRRYLMEPGDALMFDSEARHGPEELIEAPMEYLSIIIYPRRQ
jgi:transcriptional regulator with XRE-family HTH domain